MIRKFINSKMEIIPLDTSFMGTNDYIVLQIENLGNNFAIVEFIENNEICDLIPLTAVVGTTKSQTQNADFDEKLEEYRSVILNKDPFGKYSGASLGEIFDNKDINWINQCLKNMKNEYIRERVAYLNNYYKL